MALKATIYKVTLNVADMDRDYYNGHQLTIARHPSESEPRLMARILAFARFASESLAFTRGLCADDEPELWEKDLTDRILHWIDLGAPSEERVRKACHRSELVTILAYGDRVSSVWWEKHADRLRRFTNLQVFLLPDDQLAALVGHLQRTLSMQVGIQGDEMWVSIAGETLTVALERWK